MALPCSADAARGIADDAGLGDALVAARPGPARRGIEDQRPHRVAVRRRLEFADALAAHQVGREREHHRGLVLAGVDFRQPPHPCTGLIIAPKMQRAEIEAEVAAQFAPERLQNAAVAAVTVDDQEIARRQRAGDLAAEIAQIPPSCR